MYADRVYFVTAQPCSLEAFVQPLLSQGWHVDYAARDVLTLERHGVRIFDVSAEPVAEGAAHVMFSTASRTARTAALSAHACHRQDSEAYDWLMDVLDAHQIGAPGSTALH